MFGEKIKQLRIDKNQDMETFAKNTSISLKRLTLIEDNKVSPNVKELTDISNYCHVNIGTLFLSILS